MMHYKAGIIGNKQTHFIVSKIPVTIIDFGDELLDV